MGWWRQTTEGRSLVMEETGLVWGDGPADIMCGALDQIIGIFQAQIGRPPKAQELRGGLEFSMGCEATGAVTLMPAQKTDDKTQLARLVELMNALDMRYHVGERANQGYVTNVAAGSFEDLCAIFDEVGIK